MISPTQRPLPDNIQHSQETDIPVRGGIRTCNPNKRAATNLRLRPRKHRDRQFKELLILICRVIKTQMVNIPMSLHTGRTYGSITTFLEFTYLSYNTWAVLSSKGPFDLKINFVDSGVLWAVRNTTCHYHLSVLT